MGVYYPSSLEDLLHFVEMNCNPTTHMVITDDDEMAYIYIVPIVTSQHRHYIIVHDGQWPPETVKEAIKRLRDKGYRIVHGSFELKQC